MFKVETETTEQRTHKEICKVHLLKEDIVKHLYHTRMNQYLQEKDSCRNTENGKI